VEPGAFLDLANTLSGQAESEAALRTSVSRSYYSLHNLLSEFITNYAFPVPKTAKSHKLVYRCIHNCGIHRIVLIGKHLDELREDRNDADYDMRMTKFQNPNVAAMSLIKARAAYNDFEQLTSTRKKRQQVVKGLLAQKRIEDGQ